MKLKVAVDDLLGVNLVEGLQDLESVPLYLGLVLEFPFAVFEPVLEVLGFGTEFHQQYNGRLGFSVRVQLDDAIVVEHGLNDALLACLGQLEVSEEFAFVD